VLKDSIRYAFDHVDDAMAYAQGFGRGISADVNSRFVRMYVNQDTLELPRDGVGALEELYRRAAASGLLSHAPAVRIIG
ncbi:MAG: hypothetical protein IH878_21155, partial [Gemmatimonadetes bacterium]|nr:hypothetical protein [Gemmatimonadota bacterium]